MFSRRELWLLNETLRLFRWRACRDQLLVQLRWTEVEVGAVRCLTVSSRQKKWGRLMCRSAGRRGNLDVSIESPSSDQFRQPVMKSAQESETFKSSWTQSWLTEKFKEEAKILHNPPLNCPFLQRRSFWPSWLRVGHHGSWFGGRMAAARLHMSLWWAPLRRTESEPPACTMRGESSSACCCLWSPASPLAQDPSGLAGNWRQRCHQRGPAGSWIWNNCVFVCVSPVCSKWSDSKL